MCVGGGGGGGGGARPPWPLPWIHHCIQMMSVHSNDTSGNTLFNWTQATIISDFFQVSRDVLCFSFKLSILFLKAEQALLHRSGGGGGGEQQATCLVAKQAVELPQVLVHH